MKVVKRILDLNFVEIAEISTEIYSGNTAKSNSTALRPPITNILQWVERFSLMAAILGIPIPGEGA